MHGLELQPAVDEIEPGRAVDVHGGAQLALREGFGVAEIGRRHAPVRERDLHVQRHRDHVGDEDEGDAERPRRDAAPQHAVAEQHPVATHARDLDGAGPGRGAEVGAAAREQVAPGEHVQVEARDGHDGVVGVRLVGDDDGGEGVEEVGEVVVRGVHVAQQGGAGGEEGDVLDVRVVFRVVRDEVVHVVAALPPADGETAAEVGDEGADEGVGDEVVGDAAVAGVVGREHDLVLWSGQIRFRLHPDLGAFYPETAEEEGGGHEPSGPEGDEEDGEERDIADGFFGVLGVAAVVEAFVLDPLVQGLVLHRDVALCGGVEGRVVSHVVVDFLLDGGGEVDGWRLMMDFGLRPATGCGVDWHGMSARLAMGWQGKRALGGVDAGRAQGCGGRGCSAEDGIRSLLLFIVSPRPESPPSYWRCEVDPGCICYPADPVLTHQPQRWRGVVSAGTPALVRDHDREMQR